MEALIKVTGLRIIPRAELQTMLATIRIPDDHLLITAQSDIGINWSQTRQLRRYVAYWKEIPYMYHHT
ncbi:Hypp6151 [Branchiostoma lanceolatum]|nr:Hypp6151 [Branchiostoma lanceolatum]